MKRCSYRVTAAEHLENKSIAVVENSPSAMFQWKSRDLHKLVGSVMIPLLRLGAFDKCDEYRLYPEAIFFYRI